MSEPAPIAARIAALLDRARTERKPLRPPPELAALSLTQAYEVQDAGVERREAAGVRRSGWKLGITSPIKQQVMGIGHPLFGRIFADGERADGSTVDRSAFFGPRIEPEIAFGLARPLAPGLDLAGLRACIAWIAPALEITDSRYLPGTRTANELVADNTSAAGYVLGPRVLYDGRALDAYPAALVCNGTIVAHGSTGDVLDDPLHALARLADHLAARAAVSLAGDVVLSGAITDAIPTVVGDVVELRLDGVGNVRVTFG